MKTLNPKLAHLHAPGETSHADINMAMLGFSGQTISNFEGGVAMASTEQLGDHIVTMAFVVGKDKFAVVDDRLYREGDRLFSEDEEEEGPRIRTITPEKVLIAGKEVREWVKVYNPRHYPAPSQQTKTQQQQQEAGGGAAQQQAGGQASVQQGLQNLKGYADMLKQLEGGGSL
ncbi:MAG: hypothetical protein HQL50_11290 [Magnetococcales bacterium]|nr:hypothetical protein [Magnetococcales bacterium]